MTVSQLLREASSRELSEWRAEFILQSQERKQAELAAKAQAREQQLRGNRRGNR